MTLATFITKANFNSLDEIDKVGALAFYLYKVGNMSEFDIATISNLLVDNGFGKPNSSRLKDKLTSSKKFIKVGKAGFFRMHNSTLKQSEIDFPFVSQISDHIETNNSILPEDLYDNTRGYIKKLAIQINAAYENNISDGCAVLMRRLLEILLILGYRAKGREDEILESGSHKKLTTIIDYSISNKVLNLQKDTTDILHDFRLLGNFSAHGITYNCRKEELTKISRKYRFAIEDMLYAAELK